MVKRGTREQVDRQQDEEKQFLTPEQIEPLLGYEDTREFPAQERQDIIGPKSVLAEVPESLEAIYVIPVSKELSNNNIFFQLRDLLRQTDVNTDQFEVLYVVNNLAHESSVELEDGGQGPSERYQENQDLLDIIAYISGQTDTLAVEMEPWKQTIVETARKKELRVQAVDLATNGIPLPSIYVSGTRGIISESRAIGHNIAKQRLKQTRSGDHGAIVYFDADARQQSNTTATVINQLIKNSTRDMLEVPYTLRVSDASETLYYDTPLHQAKETENRLEDLLAGESNSWKIIKASQWDVKDPRLFDDGDFVERMIPKKGGAIAQAQDVRIEVLDRENAEGGLFSVKRSKMLEKQEQRTKQAAYKFLHPVAFLLDKRSTEESIFSHVLKTSTNVERAQFRATLKEIIRTLITDGQAADTLCELVDTKTTIATAQIPDQVLQRIDPAETEKLWIQTLEIVLQDSEHEVHDFRQSVADIHKAERIRRDIIRRGVIELIDLAFSSQEPITYQDYVQAHSKDSAFKETPTSDFLQKNAWIFDVIHDAKDNTATPDEALQYIEGRFPSFVLPYEQDHVSRTTATLFGTSQFFRKASSDPKKYPRATIVMRGNEHHPYLHIKAERAAAAGNIDSASALYKEATEAEPENNYVYTERIKFEIMHGDAEAAVADATDRKHRRPDDASFVTKYLDILRIASKSMGEIENELDDTIADWVSRKQFSLIEILSNGIGEAAGLARYHGDDARASFFDEIQQLKDKVVIDNLEVAIDEESDDIQMYKVLIKFLEKNRETDKIKRVYEKAAQSLTRNEEKQKVLTQYALFLTSTNDHEQVLEVSRRCIEVDPTSNVAQDTRVSLAKRYVDLNRVDEALQVYEEALAQDTTYKKFAILSLCADLYLQQDNTTRAKELYEAMVPLIPFKSFAPGIYESLGDIAAQEGNRDEARNWYTRALESTDIPEKEQELSQKMSAL